MKTFFKQNVSKQFILGLLFIVVPFTARSINYTFSASPGTFTPLIAPTNIWVSGDDVTANNIPIGFSFNYGSGANLQVFSQVSVNSNGWIALGSNFLPNQTSYATNNLKTTSIGPIIAPLWDDLSITSGGSVNYQTSGSPGNQIFTVEWLRMSWQWGYSTPGISFQVKLYEANGDIEFIYREETGILHTPSASIGIANKSATDFYSLDNSTSSPTASYGTETNTINAKPVTGQIYKWSRNMATSINNFSFSQNEISVFPNPFCNEITVTWSFQPKDKLYIINVLGQKIFETELTNQVSDLKISIDEILPSGIYFLNVVSDKKRIVKRVMKQ